MANEEIQSAPTGSDQNAIPPPPMSDSELEWFRDNVTTIAGFAMGIVGVVFPTVFIFLVLKVLGEAKLHPAFVGCSTVCIGLCGIVIIMGMSGRSNFVRSRFGMSVLKLIAYASLFFFFLDVLLGLQITVSDRALSGMGLLVTIPLGTCLVLVGLIIIYNVGADLIYLARRYWPWPSVRGVCTTDICHEETCTKILKVLKIIFCFCRPGPEPSDDIENQLLAA